MPHIEAYEMAATTKVRPVTRNITFRVNSNSKSEHVVSNFTLSL